MKKLSQLGMYESRLFSTYEITKEAFDYVRGGTYVPKCRTFSRFNEKTKKEKFFFSGNNKDFKELGEVLKYLND